MKVLAVESSARTASVAIAEEGKLLSELYTNSGLTHSQTLLPMVDAALNCAGMNLSSIDLFASSIGPGSFTGIRIGVAAVKGMAQSQNKLCIGISTLETIAYNLILKDCIACSVMDARCGQVYTAVFECRIGTLKRLSDDKAMLISDLEAYLKTICTDLPFVLVGDGAEMCFDILKGRISRISLAPENIRFQRASSVADIALNGSHNNEITVANNLFPQYLRLPQAERALRIRNGELE